MGLKQLKVLSTLPGVILTFVGVVLGFMGIDAAEHGGPVSGGPIIWVFYFGGSLLLVACGVKVTSVARRRSSHK